MSSNEGDVSSPPDYGGARFAPADDGRLLQSLAERGAARFISNMGRTHMNHKNSIAFRDAVRSHVNEIELQKRNRLQNAQNELLKPSQQSVAEPSSSETSIPTKLDRLKHLNDQISDIDHLSSMLDALHPSDHKEKVPTEQRESPVQTLRPEEPHEAESTSESAVSPMASEEGSILTSSDEDVENMTIDSPHTIRGQQLGARLSVMRIPRVIKKITKRSAFTMAMDVGDVVKVLYTVVERDGGGKDYLEYAVENMRTGARLFVPWTTFIPVEERELCDCRGQRCRCVYVDYKKSRSFYAT